MIQSLGYFLLAGLCEIGGGYLVWLYMRAGRSPFYFLAGSVILIFYGIVPTFQPAGFGKVMRHTAASSSYFLFSGAG